MFAGLGLRLIQEMNDCGILIDLAHTNDPCAVDIIETSSRPVVDSHSNPRAFEAGKRSVPDEVMRALARNGGVLGVVPKISRPAGDAPLVEPPPLAKIEQSLATIRYAVDVMGIDHVGLGTHFNTMVLPWVTDGLLSARFSDEDVARIVGGNSLDLLRRGFPE